MNETRKATLNRAQVGLEISQMDGDRRILSTGAQLSLTSRQLGAEPAPASFWWIVIP